MTLYYSPGTNGFYDDALNKAIPADKVEISAALRDQLLAEQCASGHIGAGSGGQPVIVPFPSQSEAGQAHE